MLTMRSKVFTATLALVLGATLAISKHGPSVARATEVPRPLTGMLPKSVDMLNAAELTAVVAHLKFTGGAERRRLCSGTPECDAGTARTSAHIEAVDQGPISNANVPAEGVILLRIQNTGQFVERKYGLQPGAVNYLIVLPRVDSTTVARWALVEVSGSAKRTLKKGDLTSCGHGTYPGSPMADFRTCAAAAAVHSGTASRVTGDGGDPAWAACSMGCCIVQ